MPGLIANREHWLARAEEARKMAELLDNDEARREMQEIARRYERLANLCDDQASAVHQILSRALRNRSAVA